MMIPLYFVDLLTLFLSLPKCLCPTCPTCLAYLQMSVYWCQIRFHKFTSRYRKLWVHLCFYFSIIVKVNNTPKLSLKRIPLAFCQGLVSGKLYFCANPLSSILQQLLLLRTCKKMIALQKSADMEFRIQ